MFRSLSLTLKVNSDCSAERRPQGEAEAWQWASGKSWNNFGGFWKKVHIHRATETLWKLGMILVLSSFVLSFSVQVHLDKVQRFWP